MLGGVTLESVSQEQRAPDGGDGRPRASLLVTDLDNTLWDWFEIWYRSFSALLDGIVRISGIPQEELEPEIRKIHQRRGTSEYSYLIGELPPLKALHGDGDLQVVYADAINAAREAREEVVRLYPTVHETLSAIHDAGTVIAGYTESLAFVTAARAKKLGLDGVLDYLYSPADHDFPDGVSASDLRRRDDPTAYELQHTEHRHTPPGHLKPAPEVLQAMVEELSDGGGVVYVGDSLMKDIAMAQEVGAMDVWAAYGQIQNLPEYALLQRVSHWIEADVQRELEIKARPHVTPTFVLHDSLAEICQHFDFIRNERR